MVTRKVRVNGRVLEIEAGSEGTFLVYGKRVSASLHSTGPDSVLVLIEGRSYDVWTGSGEFVVNGEPVDVSVEDPRQARAARRPGASGGRQTLTASMPGKIVRVLVSAGDSVEAGQGLVIVEAMKMQNEVRSPTAGRVVSVGVGEGASVAAGAVLVIVE